MQGMTTRLCLDRSEATTVRSVMPNRSEGHDRIAHEVQHAQNPDETEILSEVLFLIEG